MVFASLTAREEARVMKKFVFLLLAPALAGCATSAAGLADRPAKFTLQSGKTPQSWATCAAEKLIGNNQLRNEGDHYWLLRFNGYGIPVVRWDFYPAGTGARAELRATIGINTGDEKVRACSS
jgi:hypothetical protein